MSENKTILNFIVQIFEIFGIIVTIFIVLTMILPDDVATVSSLFSLGKEGLSLPTLLELWLMSLLLIAARIVFLTDRLITGMSILLRNIFFFITILVIIVVFVIIFKWFPVDDIMAWFGLLISYIVCTSAGVILGRILEKAENDKMEEALKKYRE